MPEVSWTSDKRRGDVFGLVEPFRITFMFGINSSGQFNGTGQSSVSATEGGWFDVRYVREGW